MECPTVCRICLVMDVKMYDLNTYPLDTYFDAVTGANLLDMGALPRYLCFECSRMVKKFHEFKEKCLFAQSVLFGILHTSGQITSESIQQIDRVHLNLTSPLKPSLLTEDSIRNLSYDYENPYVKVEIIDDEDSDNKEVTFGDDDRTNLFKYEDDVLDRVSSDDEPLSLHKERKKKTPKNKKVKADVTSDHVVGKLEDKEKNTDTIKDATDLLKEVSPTVPSAVEAPKRKRGRPRKNEPAQPKKPLRPKKVMEHDDEDVEEYCTVVALTLEQQLEEITKRKSSSNYVNSPFQCHVCYKGFVEEHAWKHHMEKHGASYGDIECEVCRFRFKTKRSLQKHSAHHKKNYLCKSCPYVSKTSSQAKQHQRWHKGVTYKCQHCDEISVKWTSYLSHVRNKHPSQHVCDTCGYSFVSQLGLHMHRTMMHKHREKVESDVKDEGLFCAECDVRFVTEEAYRRHLVHSDKHTQGKVFKSGCGECGARFGTAEELRLHHRRQHPKRRPHNYGKKPSGLTWPTNCTHCSEEIANGREYWAHFRRMHPDESYPIRRDYVCDICGKSFRGNAFLVYHKRTHFTERAYQCPACPKAFFNRNNLILHEKTHSDARPYPCNVCYKAFKCKGALDRHYRSHTGEKPYKCEVCSKAFGQSNTRNLHMRTVHLKLPAPYVSRARQDKKKHNQPAQQQFIY